MRRHRALNAAARFQKRRFVQALLRSLQGQELPMANASASIAHPAPTIAKPAPAAAARTRLLLEGSIVSTLLRLAALNVVLIAVTATVDAHFVGRLGPEALAGISLVFPLIMLMQQVANSSMGGAMASAIARAIGAGRHEDASALVLHAVVIAAGMAALFASVLLVGGPAIYGMMGGAGATRAAALEYSNALFAGALAYWLLSTLTSVVRGAGQATVLAVVYLAAGAHRNPALAARRAPRPAAVR